MLTDTETIEVSTNGHKRRRIDRAALAQYVQNRALYYAEIRNMTRLYKDLQAQRKASRERIRAILQGRAQGDPDMLLSEIYGGLEAWEKKVGRLIEILIEQHPLYAPWISRVRGVGTLSMGQLMGIVGSVAGANGQPGIGAFDTVSKLWRFCGIGMGQYYVVDGKAVAPVTGSRVEGEGETRTVVKYSPKSPKGATIETLPDKPIPGFLLPYSAEAKTICLEFIGSGIIKANGAYRRLYDEAKDYYHASHPDWNDGHCHNAARRKMVKVWMSHLWHLWREAEGYDTRGLWVNEYGGHTTVYDWQEFVE